MVNDISVQYSGAWASPRHYTGDPRLLPVVGNPFKYHVVALYL